MAKIKFDNTEYEVDDSVISAGKTNLVSHAQNMSGSDGKIVINGVTYNVGGTAFTNAVATMSNILEELSPSGMSVEVTMTWGDPTRCGSFMITQNDNVLYSESPDNYPEDTVIEIDPTQPVVVEVVPSSTYANGEWHYFYIYNGDTLLYSRTENNQALTYTIPAGTVFTKIAFDYAN